MVNIGKRMRRLKPQVSAPVSISGSPWDYSHLVQLLDIRCGPGAQLLPRPPSPDSLKPPPHHPILTRLHFNVPVLAFRNSHSSSLYFWRNHLRQLKYHNPGLPITVGREPYKAGTAGSTPASTVADEVQASEDSPPQTHFGEYKSFLQLTFAGSEEQLRNLQDATDDERFDWSRRRREEYEMNKSGRGPRRVQRKPENEPAELTEDEREAIARQQSPNWRDAPGRDNTQIMSTPAQGKVEETSEPKEQRLRSSPNIPEPPLQPAESSSPTSVPPLPCSSHPFPSPIHPISPSHPSPLIHHPLYTHTRTLTFNTEFRPPSSIWHSLASRSHPTPVPPSVGDEVLRTEIKDWEARGAVDRERVKKMVDARKRNEEMLRRARGEVERLRAEA